MFSFIKSIFYGIVYGGIIFIVLLYFLYFINILVLRIKGTKFPKRKSKSEYKKRNIFLTLFYDLPRALARDYMNRNPDSMPIHGLFFFCGAQGSGKTAAAVHFLRTMVQKYPLIKIRSNISISFQHGNIRHWTELINVHNGDIGQIDFIDELQNWFSSADSKNFNPDVLQEITQERKKHKVIVGTSQVFTRLAKPFREQCTYMLLPHTFFGCFTIVLVYKPEIDDKGNLIKKHFIKIYCFVHDDDLRQSYDTWEKVERLSRVGFASSSSSDD